MFGNEFVDTNKVSLSTKVIKWQSQNRTLATLDLESSKSNQYQVLPSNIKLLGFFFPKQKDRQRDCDKTETQNNWKQPVEKQTQSKQLPDLSISGSRKLESEQIVGAATECDSLHPEHADRNNINNCNEVDAAGHDESDSLLNSIQEESTKIDVTCTRVEQTNYQIQISKDVECDLHLRIKNFESKEQDALQQSRDVECQLAAVMTTQTQMRDKGSDKERNSIQQLNMTSRNEKIYLGKIVKTGKENKDLLQQICGLRVKLKETEDRENELLQLLKVSTEKEMSYQVQLTEADDREHKYSVQLSDFQQELASASIKIKSLEHKLTLQASKESNYLESLKELVVVKENYSQVVDDVITSQFDFDTALIPQNGKLSVVDYLSYHCQSYMFYCSINLFV